MDSVLRIGDRSANGQVEIVDEDRLCYLVKNDSNGARGLRTISKKLLGEFVAYVAEHPDCNSSNAREALCGNSEIDRFEYGYCATLLIMAKMVLEKMKNAPKESQQADLPLQQIYYGAPGTGKSYEVKRHTDEWDNKGRVVRTTFHPDSDYSTFVGAYKPTMEETDGGKRITYEFVGQAFLQAYVDAWNNRVDPEYLVIEEINRGNCAQIFGDLFQLLDRGDDGFSEYPIRADKDLQNYLLGALMGMDDVSGKYVKVKQGEIMLLPDNLYILATMNTSDQSLFPIDSAFKRRWDWVYIPIADAKLNWVIDLDGEKYSWWEFVQKINGIIYDTTNSADKQLGYFFCKAKNDWIDANVFVSKVVFYLWNDVFKDYGFENEIFTDKDDNTRLTFDKFTEVENGKVRPNIRTIQKFLQNLGLEEIVEEEDDVQEEKKPKLFVVNFPDGTSINSETKFETYKAAICKIGLDKVEEIMARKKYTRVGCALVSKVQEEAILNSPKYSYVQEGEYYIVKGFHDKSKVVLLNYLSDELGLNLEIIYK